MAHAEIDEVAVRFDRAADAISLWARQVRDVLAPEFERIAAALAPVANLMLTPEPYRTMRLTTRSRAAQRANRKRRRR